MEYQGESAFKIYMERKPHPWGFKFFFFWCFSMSKSKHPVLYKVIPDLRLPIHTPSEIVKLVALIPQGTAVSITADSWFASLQLMEAHPNVNFTFRHQRRLVGIRGQDLCRRSRVPRTPCNQKGRHLPQHVAGWRALVVRFQYVQVAERRGQVRVHRRRKCEPHPTSPFT